MTMPVCSIKHLPSEDQLLASILAVAHNPANEHPDAGTMPPAHLAVMRGKYWSAGTVLTVSFLERVPADLAAHILGHMNAWHDEHRVDVRFAMAPAGRPGQVRITLAGDGYWSYIGTDILSVPSDQPTMCLQAFSMAMPEGEFHRVVRHETGHTLGFPHEHSRQQIVDLLDPAATIRYFATTQGWSEQEIREQILTPISAASIMGTPQAETDSIMCYQFPGQCTKSGQPIPGGLDITGDDGAFARSVLGEVAGPANPPAPGKPTNPTPTPPAPPTSPPAKPPAPGPRLRGYTAADPAHAPRPFVVYVKAADGTEVGYHYDGVFRYAAHDRSMIVFDGPARVIG